MRDILPPKNYKNNNIEAKKQGIKQQPQVSNFTVTRQEPSKKKSYGLLIFLFLILIVLAGAAYYYLYLNQNTVTSNTEPRKNENNAQFAEASTMISGLGESIEGLDQNETDLDFPTIDLNIDF